jgi:hypothetical protein
VGILRAMNKLFGKFKGIAPMGVGAASGATSKVTAAPMGASAALSESQKLEKNELPPLRTKHVEAAEARNLSKRREKIDAEGSKLQQLKTFRLRVETILKPLKGVFDFMFDRKYPISHYIALIIVIMLLLGLLFWASNSSRRRNNQGQKRRRNWFDRLFPNKYKASLLANRIVGGDIATEPRETIIGRCDNVQYQESGNLCINTKVPDPIMWDLQSLDELGQIPQSLRDRLTKDGVLLKVFIPWEANGSFFVPNCNKAYYLNGEKSFLLIDDGFQCNKASFEKMTFQQAQRINKIFSDYKGLDIFE